jgi:hypothetical protein
MQTFINLTSLHRFGLVSNYPERASLGDSLNSKSADGTDLPSFNKIYIFFLMHQKIQRLLLYVSVYSNVYKHPKR